MVAAAACTLGGLDGLTSGPSPLDGGNAGSPDTGVSPMPANTDADTNADAANVTPDASTPDADAATPNPPTFCTPGTHTFCWDFEDGQSFDQLQLYYENDGNVGSIDLSTDRATSGTHSVKIHVPRTKSTDGVSTTQLYHNETSAWTKVHIEVSFYVVAPEWRPGDYPVPVFGHVFYSDQGSYDAYDIIGNGLSILGGANTVQINGPALPVGVWMRGIIDFDPAGFVSGTINGVPFAKTAFDPTTFDASTGIGQGVGIGIYGLQSPMPDMTVYYDDLTLDW